MRTLKVQGKGEITVTPDLCEYSVRVSSKKSDYNSCYNELNISVDTLRNQLNNVGITNEQISTSKYSIIAVSEYFKKVDKELPGGYEGIHSLNFETPIDMEFMNTVLTAISNECIRDQMISISFGISDTETIRKQLIQNSVVAARINAETICGAAGIMLGQIVTIEYGRSDADFDEDVFARLDRPTFIRSRNSDDIYPNMMPNNITTTDTVNVVYEILD